MEVNINKISYRVITVSPDRDIAGIIDELRTVQEPQIYLYLPDTLKALRNTLNAQLIQNESALLGKDLILISQDFQTRNTAKRVGIPTLTTLPNQETQRRNIPGGERRTSPQRHATDVRMYDIIPPDLGGASPYVSPEVFYSARDEEPEEVEMHEEDAEEDEESPMLPEETYGEQEVNEMLEEVPREKGKEFFEKIPYQRSFTDTVSLSVILFGGVRQIMRKMAGGGVLLLIGGGILVGIGIFLYVVLPKAEVRLEPKKDRIVFDLASRVDTQRSGVDLAKNIIPGQFLESSVERSQDFLSSGREIREERAQGIITVYNEYSSSPQTLVENTRFISQDGKLFRSAKTVVVPGASISEGKIVASNIDMEVIAQEAGEGYNVGPSTFSIPGFKGTPKYTAFYGKSSNSMEGGFIGEVEVVTADDLKQAEDKFRENLLTAAREDFERKKPADFVLLKEAVEEETVDISSTKKAGEAAKSFTLSGKTRVTGFVFDERDVYRLVDETIQARISQDKEVVEGSKQLTYKEVKTNSVQGEMSMLVTVEELIAARVDEGEIINAIKGKSLEETREYLASHPALESARVTFSPFWIKRVPRAPDKIKIEILRTVDPVKELK